MLQSKFAKKTQQFQAQKIFTDRVEPRAVFRKSIAAWEEKSQEIITYYGKGGIGKSKLLKSILEQSGDIYSELGQSKIHNIFISLDAYEYANPVNILMSIRNSVTGDCGLFDYALVQYCSKAKLSVDEIMEKNDVLSSPVMDVLNEVISIGTSSACIPTAIMKKCISFIKDMRFKEKYKEEIEELDGLNEFDIFERLPYYLGVCISYAASKGDRHVIFLDSYESALLRTVSMTPSVGNEDWLKELFLSSEQIRLVIASRDKIRWEKEDEDWKEFLNQHLLQNLSDEDSKWFLEQVPIRDGEVIAAIVNHAGGVPLYLDMCVDIYEAGVNENKPFDLSPLQKGEKVIDRYIRHLTKRDKFAVRILSMPRVFDREYAVSLLKKENLDYNGDEMEELLEKSIILPLEEIKGLYKVDESVRLHLHEQMEEHVRKEIVSQMLCCIREGKNKNNFTFFAGIMELVFENPVYIGEMGEEGLAEQLLELTEYYGNAGYWNELHTLYTKYSDTKYSDSQNPLTMALITLEELLYLRRTGRLEEARAFAKEHPLQKEQLGVWFYFYRYFIIQIGHLQGRYDESLAGYKELLGEMDLIKTLIPVHIYNMVSMKYADLLFLKGRFSESLKIVEMLLENHQTPLVDKIELLRIKGHIYRFNHKYEQAQLIYQSAMKLVMDNGLKAYQGKLANNMTETLCMKQPEEALIWYEKSADENGAIGNDIELGKSQAAASAAYTVQGQMEEAVGMALEAIATAKKTGYKSGELFGLAALCYAYGKKGSSTEEAYDNLCDLAAEINVYPYIVMQIADFLGKKVPEELNCSEVETW